MLTLQQMTSVGIVTVFSHSFVTLKAQGNSKINLNKVIIFQILV